MDSTNGSLLSLAGRTIAQLRELARNSPLANIYSRLSRSQLIDALQQVASSGTSFQEEDNMYESCFGCPSLVQVSTLTK